MRAGPDVVLEQVARVMPAAALDATIVPLVSAFELLLSCIEIEERIVTKLDELVKSRFVEMLGAYGERGRAKVAEPHVGKGFSRGDGKFKSG